ncbi:hypothetical protein KIPB_010333 [Kipferlia bialata]|uniref:Uncharacterized protein n=1 Tax=Kipferlia bialata TaxID=797122 RepID=A0A9K3D5K8_9EUKA|nr:hypothetical protein KIPB_010333 [Kipferlia bialata]|eukprot:g10333.t1
MSHLSTTLYAYAVTTLYAYAVCLWLLNRKGVSTETEGEGEGEGEREGETVTEDTAADTTETEEGEAEEKTEGETESEKEGEKSSVLSKLMAPVKVIIPHIGDIAYTAGVVVSCVTSLMSLMAKVAEGKGETWEDMWAISSDALCPLIPIITLATLEWYIPKRWPHFATFISTLGFFRAVRDAGNACLERPLSSKDHMIQLLIVAGGALGLLGDVYGDITGGDDKEKEGEEKEEDTKTEGETETEGEGETEEAVKSEGERETEDEKEAVQGRRRVKVDAE